MSASSWQAVRVLIAGCGSIGRRHARILRSLGVRDLRVCDPSAEQRRTLLAETAVTQAFATFEEGLASRPDAVFICTPPGEHVRMAIQALKAGCHAFVEKPLSDSLDGVDELEKLVAKTGRCFMVGLCFRFHEGLLKAKAYLDEGRIGRLVSIRCRMGEHLPQVRPDYRTLFTSQTSGAFDLTHEIDLACWFAGARPVREVRALYGSFSDIGIQAPDVAEILVQFGADCLASIHLDFFGIPRQRRTELLGTRGAIAVEFADWNQCEISICESGQDAWRTEKLPTERDFMFRSEDSEFLHAIIQARPVSCNIGEGRKSLAIVCAARNYELKSRAS